MDDEPRSRKSVSMGLVLIGLTASLAAMMATGGLAVAAGAIGLACLGGSLAISLSSPEMPCEPYNEEYDEVQSVADDVPGDSPCREAEPCHRWRQSVAASRCGDRRR